MKILVMGGTRYFGKRLVDLLIGQGHELSIATSGRTAFSFSKPVRHFKMERQDADSLQVLGEEDWDLVYDQICSDAYDARGACTVFSGRVKRYVNTSTIRVYAQPGIMYGEQGYDPLAGQLIMGRRSEGVSYGEGKRQAEAVFAREAAFPVLSVRLPVVLGLDDYTRRLEAYVDRVLNRETIYVPVTDMGMSMISSAEAARFLAWAGCESSQTGPVNACSDGTVFLKDIAAYIGKSAGKPVVCEEVKQVEHALSPLFDLCSLSMNNQLARENGYGFDNVWNWLSSDIDGFLAAKVGRTI